MKAIGVIRPAPVDHYLIEQVYHKWTSYARERQKTAPPFGFIVCCDDWVVQVGVRPEWRGRGLAAALVVEALRRMCAAGGRQALLDVNVNNPSAARVYARLAFATIGRRARYIQERAEG